MAHPLASIPAPDEHASVPPAEVLVIVAHPQIEQSRANRRLMQTASALQRSDTARVEVRDLYALYPDYLIDVAAEQAALAAARLVVWQHPIHWYYMPPLMKLWVDDVLAFGWAYGPDGNALRRQGPLAGRHHRRRGGLVPAGQLQPLFLRRIPAALRADGRAVRHALPAAADAARRAQGERGRDPCPCRRLRASGSPRYPDWPELDDYPEGVACEVPLTARPLENLAESSLMEHDFLAERRPGLPGRRGDRRAAGAARSVSARSSATSSPASRSARGGWGW